jgi:hypothetical protein
MKRLAFLALLLSVAATPAAAQFENNSASDDVIKFHVGIQQPDPEHPGEMLPYEEPVQPNIPQVKFLKQDPPTSLKDQIDRLLYGVKVDIPPEYDVYGYELRRYMAHIGGKEVYADPARVKEELKNIHKAKIILDYWRKDMMKQNDEIRDRIEAENPGAEERTGFKYNAGIVGAFLTECQGWIERNEDVLQFLADKEGQYSYSPPDFTFHNVSDRAAFAAKYTAAKKAHGYIVEYSTFAMMVY